MYRADVVEFSSKLRAAPEILDRTVANIRRAIDFLRQRCAVTDLDLLPYPHQLVMLSEVFHREARPDPALLDRLEAWFWISTYGTLFTNITSDRVQFTLETMRAMIREPKLYWTGHAPFEHEPLLGRFNWANVRARAFALRLATRSKRSRDILAKYGRQALQHLIAREDAKDLATWSNPGNYVLMAPEDDAEHSSGERAGRHRVIENLRWHLSHEEPAPGLLHRHAISGEALDALRHGDYALFIRLRWETLDEDEEAHIASLLQRFPIERA